MDKFKVVTVPGGTTAYAGTSENKAPARGADRAQADADCKARNASAEALGIKTRYEVVPFA